ncbi:MAG: hypothetical protein ACK4S4_14820 [Pyrinomonadaceae bacterium]
MKRARVWSFNFARMLLFLGAAVAAAFALNVEPVGPALFSAFGEARGAEPRREAGSIPEANAAVTAAPEPGAFRFIEPIGSGSPTAPERLDTSLLSYLKVEVCRVELGGNCTLVASLTSAGAYGLRSAGSHFIVNWNSNRTTDGRTTYRVRVLAAGLPLGAVDVPSGTYSRFGMIWPIKFVVERDAALHVRVLAAAGLSLWEIAAAIRAEFGLCGDELASLLLSEIGSATPQQVAMVLDGVCQDPVIPVTTKIADAPTRAALVSYDQSTGAMHFAYETSLLRSLNVDDVLVSQIAPAAPYGFLRKVVSIRRLAGEVHLATVQAKLTEAISAGHLDASGELRPPTAPGLAADRQTAASDKAKDLPMIESVDEGDNFTFQKDLDVTIDLAASGSGVEGTGTIRVQGSVFFNAGYNLGLGIESCFEIPPVCVDRVEAWAGVDQRSSLRVTGRFNGTLNKKEQVVGRVPLSPIVFFIGPFPVVLVPVVNVVVGVDGRAQVNFSFDAGARSKVKVGAKWTDPDDNGNGWENISHYEPLGGTYVSASLNGNAELHAYGKVDAKLLLYNVFGPGMNASVGVSITGQTNRQPLWSLYGRVKSRVNVTADAGGYFGISEVWAQDILDRSFLIKDAENQPPVFTDVRRGLIPVPINENVVLGPRFNTLQGFFNVSDPEGRVPTVTAVSSRDGAIPLTFKFLSAGQRTITLTATDGDGGTATETLQIDVKNSLPIVTIKAASFTVPAMVQYFPTATAFDPENGYLSCDRLSWHVQGTDSVTVRNRNGTCAATVTFREQGLRPLTVNAVDLNGTTGSSTVYVNVTATPDNLPPVIDPDSFTVQAYRGPCPGGFYCEARDDGTYYNGQTGDYNGAMFMRVNATDPEGQSITIRWYCETGSQQAQVTTTGIFGNGYYTCQTPIVSPGSFMRIYAIVSDGVSESRTEVRSLFIAPLLN